jgi:hypothetical protein
MVQTLGESLRGYEESIEAADPNFQLPSLGLGAGGRETKESRRKALSRLDYLLEQLERANLGERRSPPSGVVRELIEGGLSNPMTYTIPQLMEIVFNSQERLMRANKAPYRTRVPDSDHDDRDRLGYSGYRSKGQLGPSFWS